MTDTSKGTPIIHSQESAEALVKMFGLLELLHTVDPFQNAVPCWLKFTSPQWLRERVNDACGTPNRHPFWVTVTFEDRGNWRTFQRDLWWFAFDRQHNAWYHFRTREEMMAHTNRPGLDIWA